MACYTGELKSTVPSVQNDEMSGGVAARIALRPRRAGHRTTRKRRSAQGVQSLVVRKVPTDWTAQDLEVHLSVDVDSDDSHS